MCALGEPGRLTTAVTCRSLFRVAVAVRPLAGVAPFYWTERGTGGVTATATFQVFPSLAAGRFLPWSSGIRSHHLRPKPIGM